MDGFAGGLVCETKLLCRRFSQYISVALVLTLLLPRIACAEGIADNLLDFLLGSEADAAIVERDEPELDHIVQGCVGCHDGTGAVHITVRRANTPMQYSSYGNQGSHPVGMNYGSSTAVRPNEYTGRLSLNPNIMLVNGKVSCVSCHRLKEGVQSRETIGAIPAEDQHLPVDMSSCSASGELTVGPTQTDLCLACHKI